MKKSFALALVLVLTLALLWTPGYANSQLSFRYVNTWGEYANSEEHLNNPLGIAYSAFDDTVVVADSGNYRVVKYDSTGTYLGDRGRLGFEEGDYCYSEIHGNPTGLVVDSDGNVYATETCNYVIVNDAYGDFIESWGNYQGYFIELGMPQDIELFGEHSYVINWATKTIHKTTLTGRVIDYWGSKGEDKGEFLSPRGIAIDSEGNIYVTDEERCNVQKFSSDGNYIMSFGSEGIDKGQLKSPWGIDVDGEDRIIVADTGNGRIQVFDKDGNYLAQWGSNGILKGEYLESPIDVTCDDDSVYILDSAKNLVKKVELTDTASKINALITKFEENEDCFLPLKDGDYLESFKDQLYELDMMIRRKDIIDRETICKIVKVYECLDRKPFPSDLIVGDFEVLEEMRLLLIDLKTDYCN